MAQEGSCLVRKEIQRQEAKKKSRPEEKKENIGLSAIKYKGIFQKMKCFHPDFLSSFILS